VLLITTIIAAGFLWHIVTFWHIVTLLLHVINTLTYLL